MQWTQEAEAAVGKVPFFVRKKVRRRVEKEASQAGKTRITIAEVKGTQTRFLKKMSGEVKGFQVDSCFGQGGCPQRVIHSEHLLETIEKIMSDARLLDFLKERVEGDLKFHHEFRISIADCPNACSQVQIKDVGIIGAITPRVSEASCSACGACLDSCREEAIRLTPSGELRDVDLSRCVHCGSCISVCPTGTIATGRKGYRVMIGGKLGRHPRLAVELPCVYGEETVMEMLQDFIDFYKARSKRGQRFSSLLTDADIDEFSKKWPC